MGDYGNQTTGGFDLRDRPWLGLAYLFFLLTPLLFQPFRWSAAWPSALAIAVFLPLYFSFYRKAHPVPAPLAHVLAVATIGLALIPFNIGGNTMLIYAAAMAATALPPRRVLAVCAILLLITAVEFWRVIPNGAAAFAMTGVVAVIGGMAVAGILYSRARAQANAQLRLTQDEVRRLAAMAERERIGRDLHDLLGHTLSVVALKSELAGKLFDRDPSAAREQIAEVETVARQALAQVREAVAGIRAAGLHAELAAARLALLSAEVRLDQRLPALGLDERTESVLSLTVREAVTNIIRHAHARRVEIEVLLADGELRMSISDDGCGGVVRQGNGLLGMHERIASINGSLEIDSPPGAGTRLLLRAPGRLAAALQ